MIKKGRFSVEILRVDIPSRMGEIRQSLNLGEQEIK